MASAQKTVLLLDKVTASIAKGRKLVEEADKTADRVEAKMDAVRTQALVNTAGSGGDGDGHAGAGDEDVEDSEVESLCQRDRLLQWLKWQQWVEDTDKECRRRMAAVVASQDDKDAKKDGAAADKAPVAVAVARHSVSDLSEIETAVDNLARVNLMLSESGCGNLKDYCRRTFDALVRHVVAALEDRIEASLTALNYPRCILHEDVGITLRDEGERAMFQDNFCLLIALARTMRAVEAETAFEPSEILLRPLRKRFRFHFWGKKKTNNLVRPEWYLQQVKLWMKNVRRFHETCFFAAKYESSLPHFWRLLQGLSQLATDKLRADAPEMVYDDVLLSHAIDEILIFTKELHDMDVAKRIEKDKFPAAILADESISSRWLSLERKYAFEKIDQLLLDDDGWIASPANPDILKCAENFVALLQSITARYKLLDYSELQLKFVRLQCELLEDFRMRLAQILRQEQTDARFGLILNSAHYLVGVLESWTDLPLFLHLQYVDDGDVIFSTVADGFIFLVEDLSRTAASNIVYEFRARSLEYRKSVNWMAFRTVYENTPTTEMLGMVQALTTGLDNLNRRLSEPILHLVLEHTAREVANFYLNDVVLDNMFDESGVEQLAVDVRLGILPIFRQFAFDPDRASLQSLGETLALLEARRANAMLLADSIRSNDSGDMNQIKDTLAEFGVFNLSGSAALKILERRVDLVKL